MIGETLFGRYAYWKVLAGLATGELRSAHVQEISRKTGLSAGMASGVLRRLERLGIVSREKRGNQHVYSMGAGPVQKEIRRLVFLALLEDLGIVNKLLEQNPAIISIALYGSRARGDSEGDSDVDLLVIASPGNALDLTGPGRKAGLDFNIQTYTPGAFLKMKSGDQAFYNQVARNHIILHGGELP